MRSSAALLLAAVLGAAGGLSAQTQVGDAYILFNRTTGEFRMSPGNAVAAGGSYANPSQVPLSYGVNSFGVEMDPAIGLLSTDVNDYYFPSGTWPLFFPQTGANPGNAFGSAFQTWSLPNVNGGAGPSNDSLNKDNLVIGSPWTVQTGGSTGSTGAAIPETTAVFESTIPGYEGLPEFSFGTFGPTDLTEAEALAALGATTQGGFATGNRVYSMQNVVGTQFFKIYVTDGTTSTGTGTGDLTIVATGGDAEGTNWSFTDGVLTTTAATASVDAAELVTYLASGSVTVEAANITVESSVLSPTANDLTLKATQNIVLEEGFSISTDGGDVVFWANSDASGAGGIRIGDDTSGVFTTAITTKGGDIVLGGGSDPRAFPAKYDAALGASFSTYHYAIGVFGARLDAGVTIGSGGGDIIIGGDAGSSFDGLIWPVQIGGRYGANTEVTTNGSGTIRIEGNSANAPANAVPNNSRNSLGMTVTGTVETETGRIDLIGTATVARTNARGLSLSGVVQSSSGWIRIEDRTANTSSVNFTGAYFSGARIGAGSLGSSSSPVTLIYDRVAFEDSPVVSTSGVVRVEPYADNFITTQPIDGLVLTGVSGLIVGKASNTQEVKVLNPISIGGSIFIYGSDIVVGATLESTASGGDVLLKSLGDISLEATHSIVTAGGDVILWANSDGGTTEGGVALRRGSSITSNSGNVWIGGGSGTTTWNGLTVGDGYAVGGTSVTFPDCAGCDPSASGVVLDRATINSANGHVKIAAATSSIYALTTVGANSIAAGSGTVEVEAVPLAGATLAGGISFGLHNARTAPNLAHSFDLTSSASGTAIKVTGTSLGNLRGIAIDGAVTMVSSGTGSIEVFGTATGVSPGIVAGSYNPGTLNAFAASGDITLNGGVKGIAVRKDLAGGAVTSSKITLGAGGSVASSSSNVYIVGDVLSIGESGMAIGTTGTLSVLSSSDAFASALTWPASNVTLAAGLTGLTVGRGTNTAAITIGAATSVAGPVTYYGGSIKVNANVTATNGSILLDADVETVLSGEFHGIEVSQPITIQTVGSGDITLIGRSGNSGRISGISFTDANVSTVTSAGNVTMVGRSFSDRNTGGRGVNFINDVITAGGSISITGQHDDQSSYGVSLHNTDMTAGSGITLRALDELSDDVGASVLSGGSALDGGTGDVSLIGQRLWFTTGSITTTGAVSLLPENASFGGAVSTATLTITNASSLTIGKSTNTQNVTVGEAYSVAGPVTVYGKDLAISAALSATGDMNLHASGAVTQAAALSAAGLGLHGAGTFTLTNTANNVATIAGGSSAAKLGSLSYVDASGGLTIGTVNPTGVYASGPIVIETLTGDITLSEDVRTDATSANALVLNAGKSSAIGTAAGGDILVSGTPTVSTGTGGIAKLFSGSDRGSTGLTTLVGGTANTRPNVDETTATFSPALSANNIYALYRASAEPDADESTVVASSTSVTADGSTTATITVTLKDENGNPVQGRTVTLSAGSGSSVISAASGASDASGVVTFTVTNLVAEAVTYTASADGTTITQTATVTFTAGAVDAGRSTVVASSTSVVADGSETSTITVTLRDVNGNPVPGQTVALVADGGSSVISAASGPSDARGVVTFTVTSAVVQTVTYTASVGSTTITQTASVNFNAGPPSRGRSTVTSSAESAPADGTSTTVVVRVVDESGHPVAGEVVWLDQGAGGSTISPAYGYTDENGVVRFTVSSLEAGAVEYSVWLADRAGTRYPLDQKVSVMFIGAPRLEFAQEVSNPEPALGDTIVVRYEVRNIGSADSDEVVLRSGIRSSRYEILGTTVLTDGTTVDFAAGTWTIPSVPMDTTVVLEFRAVVTEGGALESQTTIRGGGR